MAGLRTYAIGDIHGCLAQLRDLVAQIDRDARGMIHRIVCLGDYVDRGPDSAGVVALLRELQGRSAGEVICLKGNHEDLMLRAIEAPGAERDWWLDRAGGRRTLASFGVDDLRALPPDAVAWIAGCPTGFDDGRRYFVHAGLNPAFGLSDQRDEDLMWIRGPFLNADHEFGRFVVHGHTPMRSGRPDLKARRVNLDTAAVYGGKLTAGVFSDRRDDPVDILQA